MKKLFLLTCLIIASTGLLTAATSSELYTLVVPTEYSRLDLRGASMAFPGADVIRVELDTNPPATRYSMGVYANYLWYKQRLDSILDTNVDGGFSIDQNNLYVRLDGEASYKNYSLDLGGMKGFYSVGSVLGNSSMTMPFAGTMRMYVDFDPYAEIGIGRYYNIYTIKRIQTIMKHLGVTPTEEMIRAVADIMYRENERLWLFNDDNSRNYVTYYQDIANAMGIPDKALDVSVLGHSQRYAFEVQRYNGLIHGWEAAARLTPGFVYNKDTSSSTFSFQGALNLYGEYGQFIVDDKLHLWADAGVRLGFETNSVDTFYVNLGTSATLRYLPESYRYWIEGMTRINYSTSKVVTSPFDLDIQAQLYYMINPNFATYAGISVEDVFDTIAVFAGGNIRIW